MDIQEFVFESLRQIAEGVTAAKAAKPGIGVSFSVNEGQRLPDSPLVAYVGHRQHPIFFVEFDLSVTARDGATAGGKAGLSVAGFFSAGG